MQLFEYDTAGKVMVGEVAVARFEQFRAAGAFPFQAMWYCVPPQTSGPLDCHPEIELSTVLRGVATVETSGSRHNVEQGGTFLLASTQPHTVSNTSADEPLLVFSAYWMPPAEANDGDGDE